MPIRPFFQLLSAEITRQRAAAVSVTRAQSALKVDVVASIVGPPKTGVEVVTSRRNLIEAIKIPPFQVSHLDLCCGPFFFPSLLLRFILMSTFTYKTDFPELEKPPTSWPEYWDPVL